VLGTCEHTFVPEYGFTVTEHDPDRPWIIRGSEHQTMQLPDGLSFYKWAAQRYPHERFTVELDPWALSPGETPSSPS
jgi:hypothetical protein